MKMKQTEHVGLTALDAERTKLLQEYDAAVAQAADDPVRTEHGVSCEAHFRSFLEQFLPRKYGVTKGYIITPDLGYAGPLEEWDIIIYDAMEAPVLFVRRNRDENERAGKRGIPVEYAFGPYFDRFHLSFTISFVCSDNRVWTDKNFSTYMYLTNDLSGRVDISSRIDLGPITVWIGTERYV